MIHIIRTNPPSQILNQAGLATVQANAYFTRPFSARSQQRYVFDEYLLRSFQLELSRIFHSKCAYCESMLNEDEQRVDRFRPVEAVTHEGRDEMRDGYWWLAYAWANLFLACSACIARKRNQFPIGGKRARVGTPPDGLVLEKAYLISPCEDDVKNAFQFSLDGSIAPREGQDRAQKLLAARANATIQILGLNRAELLAARSRVIDELKDDLEAALRQRRNEGEIQPASRHDEAPFQGMRAQLLPKLRELLGSARRSFVVEPSQKPQAASNFPSDYATADHRSWYIRSVRIRNFRRLKDLHVVIPEFYDDSCGWLVLLGENGMGKSSLLEAIALTLGGQTAIRELKIEGHDLLRRDGRKHVAGGSVEIEWRGSHSTLTMKFDASKVTFSGDAPPHEMPIRAYGSTRRLPVKDGPNPPQKSRQQVAHLFYPFAPVCDANTWLMNLFPQRVFDGAALALKDLLGLRPNTKVRRTRHEVSAFVDGTYISLAEMSDGFQSVLVMAVDILSAIDGAVHDMQNATGIVLVDELDAHLHPRWKMQIVKALRRTLKNVQFIVSTHEPLCLRGVKGDEIAILERGNARSEIVVTVPAGFSPDALRVDQLLTSGLFGLHTTLDPELDARFRRYYSLLAREDILNDTERADLRALQLSLKDASVLGDGQREQLLYAVIDQHVATRSTSPGFVTPGHETLEVLQEIWERTLEQGERGNDLR